jgi:hypothetical protein
MDPVISLILHYALALLWLSSAAYKLVRFAEFRVTMEDYRLLPPGHIVHFVAVSLPVVEFVIGLGLLIPALAVYGAAGSAALLLIYAAAMGINLARGRRHIDCGCAGPTLGQSLSGALVLRNLLLAMTSIACLAITGTRTLLWLDYVTVVAAVATLAVGYAVFNHLVANAPELARLRV